jgi:hypothetical protein
LCRNCLLKHIIEGKIEGRIEMMGRWGRRCKELLDDLKEKRGHCKLKDEVLDHTTWRTHFGRGYRPVVRQTTEWVNINKFTFLCIAFYCVLYNNTYTVPGNTINTAVLLLSNWQVTLSVIKSCRWH